MAIRFLGGKKDVPSPTTYMRSLAERPLAFRLGHPRPGCARPPTRAIANLNAGCGGLTRSIAPSVHPSPLGGGRTISGGVAWPLLPCMCSPPDQGRDRRGRAEGAGPQDPYFTAAFYWTVSRRELGFEHSPTAVHGRIGQICARTSNHPTDPYISMGRRLLALPANTHLSMRLRNNRQPDSPCPFPCYFYSLSCILIVSS